MGLKAKLVLLVLVLVGLGILFDWWVTAVGLFILVGILFGWCLCKIRQRAEDLAEAEKRQEDSLKGEDFAERRFSGDVPKGQKRKR